MRSTPAVLVLLTACSLPLFADEPPSKPALSESTEQPQFSPTEQKLLARIQQLEERIAALEARPRAQRRESPNAQPPRLRQRVQPIPRDRAPARPPSNENVPDSWQRLEFNGQTFYIIPADDLGQNARQRAPAREAFRQAPAPSPFDEPNSSSPFGEDADTADVFEELDQSRSDEGTYQPSPFDEVDESDSPF